MNGRHRTVWADAEHEVTEKKNRLKTHCHRHINCLEKLRCLQKKIVLFPSDMVRINFGGVEVRQFREIICSLSGAGHNVFTLACGRYDQIMPVCNKGDIYFDLEYEYIKPVVSYASNSFALSGSLAADNLQKRDPSESYKKGHELFSAATSICPLFDHIKNHRELPFSGFTQLVPDIHFKLSDMLCTGFNTVLKSTLLYRGSEHGFSASELHKKCRGHVQTVTLICDKNGNVFGGYSDQLWGESNNSNSSSASESISDNNDPTMNIGPSFLFSLRKDGYLVDAPKRREIKADYTESATRHNRLCNFGQGDLVVHDRPHKKKSRCQHDVSYSDVEGESSLTTEKFKVKEIEVHAVKLVSRSEAIAAKDSLKDKTCTAVTAAITDVVLTLNTALVTLYRKLLQLRGELRFVAEYCELDLTDIYWAPAALPASSHDAAAITDNHFQALFNDIDVLTNKLLAYKEVLSSAEPVDKIITLYANDSKVLTYESTLRMAPFGSQLAGYADCARKQSHTNQDTGVLRLIIQHLRNLKILEEYTTGDDAEDALYKNIAASNHDQHVVVSTVVKNNNLQALVTY